MRPLDLAEVVHEVLEGRVADRKADKKGSVTGSRVSKAGRGAVVDSDRGSSATGFEAWGSVREANGTPG